MKGIYIITNPSYGDDIIKIGYGDDIDSRINELSKSTGILYPFVKRAVLETEDRVTDIILHQVVQSINPNARKSKNKEFFDINYEDMITALINMCRLFHHEDKLHIYEETSEDLNNEKEVNKSFRRSPFKFSMIGLKEGDTVVYIKDNNITATVDNDDKHVIYNNERYSLSSLAQELAGVTSVICGTDVFSIDGKTPLQDVRKQLEQEEI